jgi:hexokinase
VSAGAATFLNKMDFNSVTIGVDGSVYRFHPNFHDLMVEKIRQMARPTVKVQFCTNYSTLLLLVFPLSKCLSIVLQFDIMLSEDGSGRGAALVAAVASRKS